MVYTLFANFLLSSPAIASFNFKLNKSGGILVTFFISAKMNILILVLAGQTE